MAAAGDHRVRGRAPPSQDPNSALFRIEVIRVPLRNPGQARPLFETAAGEMMPTFSPDGRWVAYVSPRSGRAEVHVASSSGTGRTWQISNDGGAEPVWSVVSVVTFESIISTLSGSAGRSGRSGPVHPLAGRGHAQHLGEQFHM